MYFSVITAVYNREKYIGTAIESMLKQTCEDFEYIVVDDGSTDATLRIIESFSDRRIVLVKKPHTRCWDSKNAGLQKARGEYITFLDSDDFLSPDFLDHAQSGIKLHPGYDYYYPTLLRETDIDGNPLETIFRYPPIEENWKLIYLYFHDTIAGLPHTGGFAHRLVYERCGLYDGALYNYGDADFIVRHALTLKPFLLSALLTYYKRKHKEQICLNLEERAKTVARLMQWVIDNYPPEYILPEITTVTGERERELLLNKLYVKSFLKQAARYAEQKSVFQEYARKYILQGR